MNKILTVALGAALVAVATSASAADARGAFFINAGVGQSQFHVGHTDGLGFKLEDKDTVAALRAGYAWKLGNGFDLGVEGGYADLGKLVAKVETESTFAKADLSAKGWLVGANGKYHLDRNWYVSARAGWFHSDVRARLFVVDKIEDVTEAYGRVKGDDDGWYGGVGVGYDFAPGFSMGLNYDNYHVKAGVEGVRADGNVGTFTASLEYRF